MAISNCGYWHDLTTGDFAGLDPEVTVALLPMGAVEQHGPHLPLRTDACIAERIAGRCLELVPAGLAVLVLPTVHIGASMEHAAFAGTVTHRPETLLRVLGDIGDGVARAGVRKLVILNSHGGQPGIVDMAALGLRTEHKMLVVKINTFRLGIPSGLFEADELANDIHGGAVETSLMLHFRPDLVRMEKAADFKPVGADENLDFAWTAQDLNPAGVRGDATLADGEKGRRLAEHMAAAVAAVLRDTARFPLSNLRAVP